MTKKLIFIALSIIILLSSTFLVVFLIRQSKDIYQENNISYVSKVDGKDFVIYRNGRFEKNFLTGVNIGATKPGHFPGELAITKEEYLRWFDYIYEMNSDVIRVYTTMKPAFYEALYEFNQGKSKPLYLLQGLWMNEDTSRLLSDAYGNDNQLVNELIQDGKDLIDIFHGNAELEVRPGFAYGSYINDISKYVIGWILGVEWNPDFVIGTNTNNPSKTSFEGSYLKTTASASPFEVFLAEFGDAIIGYEAENYQMMRPVAFTNWLTTDLLDHPNEPDLREDEVVVNTEHIEKTDAFIPGLFASYHVYPYYPEFMNFSNEYDTFIDDDGNVNPYKAYLRDLNEAHSVPVIVSEFGIPASRGIAHEAVHSGYNQGNVTETEQGEMLSAMLKDIHDEGYMGGLVFAWQDEWFKRTWNTMDFDLAHRRPFWSNVQTNEQMFGILGFEPGTEKTASYADGSFDEWLDVSPLYQDDNLTLSMLHDERYLYVYVDALGYQFDEDTLYIPISTRPAQGNNHIINTNITFGESADFLIKIDGQLNSNITVDAYYDSFYYLYSEASTFLPKNPNFTQKNSGIFNEMLLALSAEIYLPEDDVTLPFRTFNTGNLTYGNANPESSSYNSLSDFYSKDNKVEIQIPWALLNISDPSTKMQLDDFYELDGFGSTSIENIHIGASYIQSDQEVKNIQLYSFTWDAWDYPTYHERLKQSYYILQKAFNLYR